MHYICLSVFTFCSAFLLLFLAIKYQQNISLVFSGFYFILFSKFTEAYCSKIIMSTTDKVLDILDELFP